MKAFLKRIHKKKIKGISLLVPFLVVFGLLFLVIWLFLGIHINFAIKEELLIQIDPLHTTKTAQNDATFNMSYTVGTDNFWQCRSVCEVNFSDLSSDKLIFSEDLSLSHDARFLKTFAFSLDERGEGQKIYRFRVQCKNEKTLVCPTDGRSRESIATLTLNYVLTDEEEQLKEKQEPFLSAWFENISRISTSLQYAVDVHEALPESNDKNEFASRISALQDEFVTHEQLQSEIVGLWADSRYEEVQTALEDVSESGLALLLSDIDNVGKEGKLLIGMRNNDVSLLQDVSKNRELINDASEFYTQENNRKNQKYLSTIGSSLGGDSSLLLLLLGDSSLLL